MASAAGGYRIGATMCAVPALQRVLDELDEDTAIAEANRLSGAKMAEDIGKIVPQ